MRNKIVFSLVMGLILLLFGANQAYLFVQKKQWDIEVEAVKRAYEQTDLRQVEHIEIFHGEESFIVLFGKDEFQRDMIVWVGSRIISRYADEGVERETVQNRVLQDAPNAELIRTIPGILADRLVWEVFYKTKEGEGVRYYYRYFSFEDGSPIDTYRLAKSE